MTRIDSEHLPHNLDCEHGLLGMMMLDNRQIEAVAEHVRAEHFSHPTHGKIYDVIVKSYAATGDAAAMTVRKYFEADGALDSVGGGKYIVDLATYVPRLNSARDYARQLVDYYTRRNIITTAFAMIDQAQNYEIDRPTRDIVSEAETLIYALSDRGAAEKEAVELGDGLEQTMDMIDRAQRGEVTGIASGIAALDEKICGFERGELSIIAARPSMGKTALALSISVNAARAGHRVLFQSLEMQNAQLGLRFLARKTGLPMGMMRRTKALSPEHMVALRQAQQELKKLPVLLDETGSLTAGQIASRAKRMKRRYGGLDMVVVDYLGLIRPTNNNANKVHQLEEITQRLKAMAKELNVHVALLCQLSRSVENREDKRPSLADLRDSGAIEQDADLIMFPYRPEYYLKKEEPHRRASESQDKFNDRYQAWTELVHAEEGAAEIIIGKFRQGEIASVRCRFDGVRQYFYDENHNQP